MSTSLLPAMHLAALRQLYARLVATDIVWVLTGSAGLAIKGLPLTPNDIDIQTDRAGVDAFAQLFAAEMVTAPRYWQSDHTRSWIAKFEIAGLPVEIMGDMRHKDEEGIWETAPNLQALRLFIQVAEMRIPTLSLEFEEEAYRSMGRRGKANFISQYLRVC